MQPFAVACWIFPVRGCVNSPGCCSGISVSLYWTVWLCNRPRRSAILRYSIQWQCVQSITLRGYGRCWNPFLWVCIVLYPTFWAWPHRLPQCRAFHCVPVPSLLLRWLPSISDRMAWRCWQAFRGWTHYPLQSIVWHPEYVWWEHFLPVRFSGKHLLRIWKFQSDVRNPDSGWFVLL